MQLRKAVLLSTQVQVQVGGFGQNSTSLSTGRLMSAVLPKRQARREQVDFDTVEPSGKEHGACVAWGKARSSVSRHIL